MKDTFQVPVSIKKIIRDKNGLIKDLVVQENVPASVVASKLVEESASDLSNLALAYAIAL